MTTTDARPVLEVDGLSVDFAVDRRWVPAAIDVSFSVAAGEVLAIVGESGSGKSVTSMAIMGLHPASAGDIVLAGQTELQQAVRTPAHPVARAVQPAARSSPR